MFFAAPLIHNPLLVKFHSKWCCWHYTPGSQVIPSPPRLFSVSRLVWSRGLQEQPWENGGLKSSGKRQQSKKDVLPGIRRLYVNMAVRRPLTLGGYCWSCYCWDWKREKTSTKTVSCFLFLFKSSVFKRYGVLWHYSVPLMVWEKKHLNFSFADSESEVWRNILRVTENEGCKSNI